MKNPLSRLRNTIIINKSRTKNVCIHSFYEIRNIANKFIIYTYINLKF